MKDRFTGDKNNNFFSDTVSDSNFFQNSHHGMTIEPTRRLNDYDYNILKEDAYKEVSDELFKLEYKISRIEEDLKQIDSQIQSARDISDYDTVEYYVNRKRVLQEDLKNLTEIYNEKSLSTKISGGLFGIISPIIKLCVKNMKKITSEIKDFIISLLPSKFSSVLEIRQSLSKLESISKSVDELMSLQTPYGEAVDKYNQLSKYITRANNIQAQISKNLK